MSLILNECDLEKIVAENYWPIFHKDEDPPVYLNLERQFKLSPYGTADIVAFFSYGCDYDPKRDENGNIIGDIQIQIAEVHVIELKIEELKERDLAQLCRYRQAINESIVEMNHKEKQYQQRYTLVGKKPNNCNYPRGSNGDLVFLYGCLLDEIDIALFEFGINGFKFNDINKEWFRNSGNSFLFDSIKEQLTPALLAESTTTQASKDDKEATNM